VNCILKNFVGFRKYQLMLHSHTIGSVFGQTKQLYFHKLSFKTSSS